MDLQARNLQFTGIPGLEEKGVPAAGKQASFQRVALGQGHFAGIVCAAVRRGGRAEVKLRNAVEFEFNRLGHIRVFPAENLAASMETNSRPASRRCVRATCPGRSWSIRRGRGQGRRQQEQGGQPAGRGGESLLVQRIKLVLREAAARRSTRAPFAETNKLFPPPPGLAGLASARSAAPARSTELPPGTFLRDTTRQLLSIDNRHVSPLERTDVSRGN